MKQHRYHARVVWTGDDGEGTKTYRSYRREHTIDVEGKPQILGSADRAFRGDPARYNPEDLLVASLSACHMLTYLHLCAVNGIVVVAYSDDASGEMEERDDGSGTFVSARLQPTVTIAAGDREKAIALHADAHHKCFVANSVNFPVEVAPAVSHAGAG